MKNRYLIIISLLLVLVLTLDGLNFVEANKEEKYNKPEKLVGFIVTDTDIHNRLASKTDLSFEALNIKAEKSERGLISKLDIPFEYVFYFGTEYTESKDKEGNPYSASSAFADGEYEAEETKIDHKTVDGMNENAITSDLIFYQKQGLEKNFTLVEIYKRGEEYYLKPSHSWSDSFGGSTVKISGKVEDKDEEGNKKIEISEYSVSSKMANFDENVTVVEYDKEMNEIKRDSILANEFSDSFKPTADTNMIIVGQKNELEDGIESDPSYKLLNKDEEYFTVYQDYGKDYYTPKYVEINWE